VSQAYRMSHGQRLAVLTAAALLTVTAVLIVSAAPSLGQFTRRDMASGGCASEATVSRIMAIRLRSFPTPPKSAQKLKRLGLTLCQYFPLNPKEAVGEVVITRRPSVGPASVGPGALARMAQDPAHAMQASTMPNHRLVGEPSWGKGSVIAFIHGPLGTIHAVAESPRLEISIVTWARDGWNDQRLKTVIERLVSLYR